MAKDKPATEIELEELQDLYLKDKDNKEVRDKYFILLKNYARSITLKILRKKGKQLPAEKVEEVHAGKAAEEYARRVSDKRCRTLEIRRNGDCSSPR